MPSSTDFLPDWVSPPGDTIADFLRMQKMSEADFALRMGHPASWAQDLLAGRADISLEVAQQLSGVTGVSAHFWMTRQAHYHDGLSRLEKSIETSEARKWLQELPLADMIEHGWLVPRSGDIRTQAIDCLRFFGAPSIRAWRDDCKEVLGTAVFRTSAAFASDSPAVAAWLRKGALLAASIPSRPWQSEAFRNLLAPLRKLTAMRDPSTFVPKLQSQCATCGVIVAVAPAPTGCRASGAVRTLPDGRRLILLSARYLSDDHFWFTFFHEAGHLVLHSETPLIVEGLDQADAAREREANTFAADILIPPDRRAEMLSLPATYRSVLEFAHGIGVSPGIVVGQLQHAKRIGMNQLNKAKRRYVWRFDAQ